MEAERSVYKRLWQACSGGMTQIPPVGAVVYYFVEGHAEHAQMTTDERRQLPRIPPSVPCRVCDIKQLAEYDSDEVYVKVGLVPLSTHDSGGDCGEDCQREEETPFFSKTLTQSDSNNGGGFSVPRYCAENLFPLLDYNVKRPEQNILARDVHGKLWQFRHIYRGTPLRHLLTTGWSNFVNQKKLVAGDSIVFLRADNGELCVGIRRARCEIGGGTKYTSDWKRRDRGRGERMKTMAESVVEAANLAVAGKRFEVVFYPRAGTPEFFVRASSVRVAMRVPWCRGMRFKMAFETEDSSRISWFLGTIASHPDTWSESPWRCLKVNWDEHTLLTNVKRVNPWQVEVVSAAMQFPHFPLPARKKMKGNAKEGLSKKTLWAAVEEVPGSIQGARHYLPLQSPLSVAWNDAHRRVATTSTRAEETKQPATQIVLFGKVININAVPQSADLSSDNVNRAVLALEIGQNQLGKLTRACS